MRPKMSWYMLSFHWSPHRNPVWAPTVPQHTKMLSENYTRWCLKMKISNHGGKTATCNKTLILRDFATRIWVFFFLAYPMGFDTTDHSLHIYLVSDALSVATLPNFLTKFSPNETGTRSLFLLRVHWFVQPQWLGFFGQTRGSQCLVQRLQRPFNIWPEGVRPQTTQIRVHD